MNGVNVFRSPIVFGSNVTTKNINFRSLYQGINITEFIRNVTALESLNDLNRYYEDLLDMSNKIESSLEGKSTFELLIIVMFITITFTLSSIKNLYYTKLK